MKIAMKGNMKATAKAGINKALMVCTALCGLTVVSCAVAPIRLTQPIGVPVAQNKVDGLNVRVSIEDVRGTQVLGSRGGLYSETSLISTDASLIDQIGDNIISAMKTQGYLLATKAPANVEVKLEALTYDVNEVNSTTKDSKVFAQMSFYVEHTKGYIQKSYNVTLEKTTILLPTQKSIEALINDALIMVMQKGLDDSEFQANIQQAQVMPLMLNRSTVVEGTPVEVPTMSEQNPVPPEESTPVETFEQEETQTFKLLL